MAVAFDSRMSATGYRLVQLANGVYSVRSLAHDETFHPVVGPSAEAEALYLRQLRLSERFRQTRGEFVVWDVGLGAAANVLTVLEAMKAVPGVWRILSFDYTLEPLAFALDHADTLGYLHDFKQSLRDLLVRPRKNVSQSLPVTRVDHTFALGPATVHWEIYLADFPSLLHACVHSHPGQNTESAPRLSAPHAVFFDAFSPATNPAMWTQALFANLFRLLSPGRPCALATYSRSTMLRVSLLLAGFFVGSGHATGEKEETTIAANTPSLIEEPLDRRWLRRARRSTSAEPLEGPAYRQAPLSLSTWEKLEAHPQFQD
jgi:tRNA U34 5-methylaminomethyl-2-thiouridine-forming methyltransferase MnmC